MKKLILLMIPGMVCLLMTSCELDPSAVVGKPPDGVYTPPTCTSDRPIIMQSSSGSSNLSCVVPDVTSVAWVASSQGQLEIAFNKLSDGSFPRLNWIQYSRDSYPSGDRILQCALSQTSRLDVRIYNCYIPLTPQDASNDVYPMSRMELANEKCGVTADFGTSYVDDPGCTVVAATGNVTLNGYSVPSLSPISAP